MTEGMAPVTLKWLQKETARGKVFYYVRKDRSAPRIRIRGEPGSPEFMAAYLAATEGDNAPPPVPKPRFEAHTLEWLARAYLASSAYAGLAKATQNTRRRLLLSVCKKAGEARLDTITRSTIMNGREERAHQPEAANGFVKVLRALFAWGVEFGYIASNPCDGVKKVSNRTQGYHTWTPEEVAQFRATHPLGTRPRLALEMALHTGLRRSDMVRLSPSHIRDGVIEIRPTKTPDIVVTVPLLAPLRAAIEATVRKGLTYLQTEAGNPFTPQGFTNWFGRFCRDAKVPGSAHGLRKAAATFMAEAGATERELMAVFGWTSPAMAALYTRAADRRKMGIAAGSKLENNVKSLR